MNGAPPQTGASPFGANTPLHLTSCHIPCTACTHAPHACQGDEEVTRITKIALMGSAGEVFNVAEIKKVGDEK